MSSAAPPRGTSLRCGFRKAATTAPTCYLDNRLGMRNALRLAESPGLERGARVSPCREEHGNSAPAWPATSATPTACDQPWNWWCVGAPGAGCTCRMKTVDKGDIDSMLQFYRVLPREPQRYA